MPTVATQKELTQTWVPLLLAAFTFPNTNTQLLVSTVPLDGVSNASFPGIGVLPAGNYLGRIAQEDVPAFQQRSQQGIDGPARVTLHMYDADHFIWANYVMTVDGTETAKYGFRGASVQIALVMWQPGTSNFTSDAPIMFIGSCDMEVPVEGGNILQVTASNSHNTGTIKLPLFPIQNRCPLPFPTNSSQRTAAASDKTSRFYPCGYSPDISGGVGNIATSGGPLNDGKNIVDTYGNTVTDANGIYLICDFTRSNSYQDAQGHTLVGGCMARLGNPSNTTYAPDGNIMADTSSRRTGMFAGIQWSPGTYFATVKNFASNSDIPAYNFLNSAILGQYHNLLYGTQFVNAKIANIIESGNDTKCEAMICTGDIGLGGVQRVIVNGIELSRAPSGDPNLFWDYASQSGFPGTGGRNGVVINGTTAYGYNDSTHLGLGDPYGSIARIVCVFYKDIFTGFGLPTIQVLATGPQVLAAAPISTAVGNGSSITVTFTGANTDVAGNPPYSVLIVGNSWSTVNTSWGLTGWTSGPPGTITLANSAFSGSGTGGYVLYPTTISTGNTNSNPVWVLLDVLMKCNWTAAEIDLGTFVTAASFCSTNISYINEVGQSSSHQRFKCQFALEQRKSASEVITGILRCFNGYLAWGQNGLLQLFINQTLADSQGSPITGSNYNTSIPSVTASGSASSGYVAYSFDETNIRRIPSGGDEIPDIKAEENTTLLTPNQIFIPFQDEDNQFVVDSLGQIDTGAVTRAGGSLQPGGSLIPETMNVLGISSFDQAIRIANVYLAERQRGNEADDARGTRIFTIGTTVKCEHLRVGHLVWLSWQAFGIKNQLFRVIKISTQTNGEIWHITLQWHVDLWYTDAYGQAPQAFSSFTGTNRPARSPLPWQPYGASPGNDVILPSHEWNFDIAQSNVLQADGTLLIQAKAYGTLPVNYINTGIKPPLVPVQASTSTLSGSVPAGNYFIQICGVDANPSNIVYNVVGAVYSSPNIIFTIDQDLDSHVIVGCNKVLVAGCSPSGFNGTFTISGASGNSITVSASNPGSAFVSGGTLTIVGNITPPSNTIIASLSSTGQITINNIGWDKNTAGYYVFVGTNHFNMTYNTNGAPGVGSMPSSITISSYNGTLSFGPPDLAAGEVQLRAKLLVHGGIVGDLVTSVSGATVTLLGPSGGTFTNNVAGHYLILYGRYSSNASLLPIVSFLISSNSGTTLTLATSASSILQVGDVVGISCRADIASATTIGDSNAPSAYYPSGFTSADIGKLVRIIAGTGRYQVRTISGVSASGTTYTVSVPWSTTPDNTSVFIVEDNTWIYNQGSTTQINASGYSYSNVATLNVDNLSNSTALFQVVVGDPTDSSFSNSYRSPLRSMWIFGAQGTRLITANTSMLSTDGTIVVNTASAVQPATTTTTAAITNTTGTSVSITDGTHVLNGTVIQIDTEQMYVDSGAAAGACTLTVERGYNGTTAATHLNGATVIVPGAITYTLLPISQIPNVTITVRKISTDINYVAVVTTSPDLFPGGNNVIILADTSANRGTTYILAPGA